MSKLVSQSPESFITVPVNPKFREVQKSCCAYIIPRVFSLDLEWVAERDLNIAPEAVACSTSGYLCYSPKHY